MQAVITVVGKDCVGILSGVSGCCAKYGANILDVNQTIMQEFFVMVMMVDMSGMNCSFVDFADHLTVLEKEIGMKINIMHEDIFNSMHRI